MARSEKLAKSNSLTILRLSYLEFCVMRPHIHLFAPLLGSFLFLGGCASITDVAFFASAPQPIVEETTQTKPTPAAAPARRVASSSRTAAPVAKPVTPEPVVEANDVDSQYARSIEQMNITQARWDREAREAIHSICGNC
jgi:hypothetical protein